MGYSPGSTILSSVAVDISWKTVTFDVKCELLLIRFIHKIETKLFFFNENDQTSVATRPLVDKYWARKPT